MSKFENWIESHSNKEFVEFHRILDIEKSDKYDKKIGFYISYVLRDRYSIKINSEKRNFSKPQKVLQCLYCFFHRIQRSFPISVHQQALQ